MKYELSVIIPVLNEEHIIPLLIPELTSELEKLDLTYEIIFVTDENKDNTWEMLKNERIKYDHINLIKLTRGQGQHVAIIAGLTYCTGSCALLMDGDLEMPPSEIHKLYTKYQEGFDIVYGSSQQKNRSKIKDMFSRLFNTLIGVLTDEKINHNTDMFRIISRKTIDKLLMYREIEPNLTFLMALINYPSISVPVRFEKRIKGKSNYRLFRKLKMAFHSILSFSTKPIRIISIVGFITSLFSFIYLFVVLVEKLFISDYSGIGFGTIIVLIIFFSGLQLFAIGIIGEYLGRNFLQSKNRPLFVIEEKLWNK